MVLTESTTLAQGAPAADFTLPDTRSQRHVSLAEFSDQPLLVVFMCNHCPYVVHLLSALKDTADELAGRGIATVAISANDVVAYPQDGPEKMAELAQTHEFNFPYCYDETQTVARAYGAVCTPDIFLFDAHHRLYYQGQFDDTRPGQGLAHGKSIRQAASNLLEGKDPVQHSTPSVGCSIKWKCNHPLKLLDE